MKPSEMIQQLAQKGVLFTVVSGRLEWNAPRGVITGRIKSELGARKLELIAVLLEGEASTGALACWCCWKPWKAGETRCKSCLAIGPGLSDAEMDEAIYGPGVWL